VGMFLLFKEGSPLAEWVHAYAKSLGGWYNWRKL
jgi:hypothetical protein